MAEPALGELTVRTVCSVMTVGSELRMYRGEGYRPPPMPILEGILPFAVRVRLSAGGLVEAAGERDRIPGE